MTDELQPLLPLRAVEVTLEFTAKASFTYFHQAAVHAFTRQLAGSPDNYDALILTDAPETGRVRYGKGDHYRYSLYVLAGGETLLRDLIERMKSLPDSCDMTDKAAPLRNNVRLHNLKDLFTETPIRDFDQLSCYDQQQLDAESEIWRHAPQVILRWMTPVRLLKEKSERIGVKGELRFCRDEADLNGTLLLQRLHDTIAEQLRQRGMETPPRPPAPKLNLSAGRLFWLDSEYSDVEKQTKPIGGMMGEISLEVGADFPIDHWRRLVLGQYIGIGQRRSFGLGRYRLEAVDGATTCPEAFAAKTLLQHAASAGNLFEAYQAIRDNLDQQRRPGQIRREAMEEEWWLARYPDPPDLDEEEQLADRLQRIGGKLAGNSFQPAPLKGVVIQEDDGDLRGLAIPPFWDRVAQRAVTQQITPALDSLMYARSYGYRKGLSRQTAGLDIQQAYRQGYRWVYEADIEDFFDNVAWEHLYVRLRAIFRDDPLINLIMAWIAAPVDYQGFQIERQKGLPQGSPISPVMANLMLDDFDSDLHSAGFRLVRYADDCVPRRRTGGRSPPCSCAA